MAAIAVLGTLDTEGDELDWLRHRILTNGSKVESSSMLAHSPTALTQNSTERGNPTS